MIPHNIKNSRPEKSTGNKQIVDGMCGTCNRSRLYTLNKNYLEPKNSNNSELDNRQTPIVQKWCEKSKISLHLGTSLYNKVCTYILRCYKLLFF